MRVSSSTSHAHNALDDLVTLTQGGSTRTPAISGDVSAEMNGGL